MPSFAQFIAVACEQTSSLQPLPPIDDPARFLTSLFLHISSTNPKITREGMDRLMDQLFALEDFVPLLKSPITFQKIVGSSLTDQMSDLFKAHWTHIILPAWEQHAVIHAAKELSRCT